MTASTYTIYIVNQSVMTPTFWCFPAPRQEPAVAPGESGNSGAVLAVLRNDQGNAAGPNHEIVDAAACEASLRQPCNYLMVQFEESSSPDSFPLTYYVATGGVGDNAPVSQVEQSDSIALTIPDSFENLACSVRYDGPGRWSQSPGAPGAAA